MMILFIEVQEATENSQENAEEIIEICVDLYEEAAEQNKIADLEMIEVLLIALEKMDIRLLIAEIKLT